MEGQRGDVLDSNPPVSAVAFVAFIVTKSCRLFFFLLCVFLLETGTVRDPFLPLWANSPASTSPGERATEPPRQAEQHRVSVRWAAAAQG